MATIPTRTTKTSLLGRIIPKKAWEKMTEKEKEETDTRSLRRAGRARNPLAIPTEPRALGGWRRRRRGSRPMETSVTIGNRASGDKRMDMTQSLAKSAVGTEPPIPTRATRSRKTAPARLKSSA